MANCFDDTNTTIRGSADRQSTFQPERVRTDLALACLESLPHPNPEVEYTLHTNTAQYIVHSRCSHGAAVTRCLLVLTRFSLSLPAGLMNEKDHHLTKANQATHGRNGVANAQSSEKQGKSRGYDELTHQMRRGEM